MPELLVALTLTEQQNWELAVAVLAIAVATAAGYLVSCFVPSAHYPRTFGVVAADAIIAGLALIGIRPVADILAPFVLASAFIVTMIYVWRSQ
jgi:ammonia channel protein AmtB